VRDVYLDDRALAAFEGQRRHTILAEREGFEPVRYKGYRVKARAKKHPIAPSFPPICARICAQTDDIWDLRPDSGARAYQVVSHRGTRDQRRDTMPTDMQRRLPSTLTSRSIFSRADVQNQVAQRLRRVPPKPLATCRPPITESPRPRALAATAK
jgi:hypothetical protein